MRPKEDSLLLPPAPAPERPRFSLRTFLTSLGPGLLVSLAYIDPGNLEADLQQGAYTRFRLVWVLWWATVMGLVLQEMSARLGVVTGKSLSEMARMKKPKPQLVMRLLYQPLNPLRPHKFGMRKAYWVSPSRRNAPPYVHPADRVTAASAKPVGFPRSEPVVAPRPFCAR